MLSGVIGYWAGFETPPSALPTLVRPLQPCSRLSDPDPSAEDETEPIRDAMIRQTLNG
jgi:hypothetical protein